MRRWGRGRGWRVGGILGSRQKATHTCFGAAGKEMGVGWEMERQESQRPALLWGAGFWRKAIGAEGM